MPVSLALMHPVVLVHEPGASEGAVGGRGSSPTLIGSAFGVAFDVPDALLEPELDEHAPASVAATSNAMKNRVFTAASAVGRRQFPHDRPSDASPPMPGR